MHIREGKKLISDILEIVTMRDMNVLSVTSDIETL